MAIPSLSNKLKIFIQRQFYVALLGLVAGLFVWLSFVRLVFVEGEWKWLLVGDPKDQAEIIFTYPNLDSGLKKAQASIVKGGKVYVFLPNQEKIEIHRDLILGRLIETTTKK